MAFSITRQPATISPVNNELSFIVSSDQYTQTNFKYIFDLYVSGTKVLRTKLFPLQDGTCLIDFGNVLKEYINNTNPNYGLTTFTSAEDGDIIDYYINFLTEDDTNDLVDHGNTDDFYTWNAIADWNEKASLSTFISGIISNSSNTTKELGGSYGGGFEVFYSSLYQNILYENEKKNISFFIHDDNDAVKAKYIRITTITTGKTRVYTITPGSLYNTKNRIGIFPIGLKELSGITWTTSVGDDISVDDGFFTVAIQNTGGIAVSKIMAFRIIPECNRYDRWSVLYTTKLGAWGSIPFNATSYKNVDLEKSVWQNIDKYNDTVYSSKRNVYSSKIETTIELSSDWVSNQFQIDNIIDMLGSPKIYIVDTTNNKVYPAVVKNNSYNWSNKKQEKLIQYRVEFVYGFNEKTRR